MPFCKAKAEIKAELDDEDHGAVEAVVDRQSPRKEKGVATKDPHLQPSLRLDLHACAATQVALMVVTPPVNCQWWYRYGPRGRA